NIIISCLNFQELRREAFNITISLLNGLSLLGVEILVLLQPGEEIGFLLQLELGIIQAALRISELQLQCSYFDTCLLFVMGELRECLLHSSGFLASRSNLVLDFFESAGSASILLLRGQLLDLTLD